MTHPLSRWLLCLSVLSLSLACKSDPGGQESESVGTTVDSSGGILPVTGSTDPSTTASADPTTTTGPATTTGPETTGPGPTTGGSGLACGGKVYLCTDGMDNDGDGKFDLDDPECTGPCDDDEASFQTGISGDNVDCKQDCFFDGNSGQGEGCTWDLKCDPENPGGGIGCAYTGGNQCEGMSGQSDECKMNCEQYVPNGCDCFGCCTVSTPSGEVNVFLNSSEECSLLDLAACAPCTPQIEDCGNDCNPDDCELCFGESELPEGCEEPGGCQEWEPPCKVQTDCPEGLFCVTGCCIAPPQG